MTALPDIPILSIRQPWAWAIVEGFKPVENRTWATKYRGPILIHAGVKADDAAAWRFVEERMEAMRPNSIVILPRKAVDYGGIVGMADLVDCVEYYDSPWFFGPYGFVLANARPLPFVPMKGRLGFFRANKEVA